MQVLDRGCSCEYLASRAVIWGLDEAGGEWGPAWIEFVYVSYGHD